MKPREDGALPRLGLKCLMLNLSSLMVLFLLLPALMVFAACAGQAAPQANSSPASLQVSIEVFIQNLDTPWAIDFAPDGRIFTTERPGRIRVVKDGSLISEPWMTLAVAESGESGLLGLAIDPDFTRNGFIYAAYTYQQGDRLMNRLVRLHDDPSSGKGELDKVLLNGVAGSGNHDGGRVKFGADGKLYWTMGDAGNAQSAQDLTSLNGKILRLNKDGTVPADNPFANSPVFSYGHRNPQGLAWQPGTGRLYETEHGPSRLPPGSGKDEVNYIEPGKNYGWPLITGDETREGMVSPVWQSGADETWAPSGATFASKGPWAGSLLFTGLRGQALYRLTLDDTIPRRITGFEQLLRGQFGRLRDVVQGPDNSLYILTSNRDGRGNPRPGDDKVLRILLDGG